MAREQAREQARERAGTLLLIGAGLVVALAIGYGIALLDPPQVARERKLDLRRVADLEAMTALVDQYTARHRRLPADWTAVRLEPDWNISYKDPDSGAPYEYAPQDAQTYRLCAVFARDTRQETTQEQGPPYLLHQRRWLHGAGHVCFTLETKKPVSLLP